MPIIFFEGFNCSNSDDVKSCFEYMIPNDYSKISFGATYSNTDNSIELTNRPKESGLNYNNYITFINFTDPLLSNNGFGIGYWLSFGAIRYSDTDSSSSPHNENLMSLYSDSGCNNEILRFDVIRTTYSGNTSIGLGIYQNGSLITTYDFSSYNGYSWSYGGGDYSDLYGENDKYISDSSYIEFYIDSKNNNQLLIRYSATTSENIYLYNSSNNIYTSISGFNNLSGIRLYGASDSFYLNRCYDDFYITSSNTASGALLGGKTKIHKLSPASNSSTVNWEANSGYEGDSRYAALISDDGDTSYLRSSTSGSVALFNISDLSTTPSGINGIKIINILRKNEPEYDMKAINVMTSGEGGAITNTGSEKLINSLQYSSKSSFIFTNPITGSGWTVNDINNMQIGIKNLGRVY